MAAPEYVPSNPTEDPRAYKSPPRRPEPWMADRPAEVVDRGQPRSTRLGNQGPDQGYVLHLARRFDDRLHLSPGEHAEDAVAGCVAVALKRASLFGRAPLIHDLTVAFTVWGFLDEAPDPELVDRRRRLFDEVRHPHHYGLQRAIADAVPEATLRSPHDSVAETYRSDWRSLLDPEGTAETRG